MNGSHGMKIVLLIAVTGLVLIAVKWAFARGRRLPRHRVRHLRVRLRLRLHPGKGHATTAELWWRWGRLAAFRRSRRSRPSLTLAQRILATASQYSVLTGRAQYRHALRLPLDEHAVIFSPPRGGKTGWLARVILRYPGPVLSTTTKHDVFELTSGIRARRGPVHVFNPQLVGGVPSTFRWNPLEGCQEPAVAIRRADAFAHSVSQKGVEDSTFWAAKASDYLRAYFHAAAIAGLDLRHVARWVSGTRQDEPEDILATAAGAAQHMAAQLAEMRGEANKTISTVRMTMSRALAFLARHPVMTPEMIRQLPDRYALIIRGGMSPAIARLPMAWKDPAYRNARRARQAIAVLTAAPEPAPPPFDVPRPREPWPPQETGPGTIPGAEPWDDLTPYPWQ